MIIRRVALGRTKAVHDSGSAGKTFRLLAPVREDSRFFFGRMGGDINIELRIKPHPHERISKKDRATERCSISHHGG